MEIIAAFIGAIIGASVSFTLSEYSKHRGERKKVLTAIRSEIKLNLDVAEEVLEANSDVNFKAADKRQQKWCVIVPMSEVAWMTVLSTGRLYSLNQETIESLSRAFAMVKRANFAAGKIQAGRFEPKKGKEYNSCVRRTRESLIKALKVLEEHAF